MSATDAIRLALSSLGRRWGRAVLTATAVALASALLTALVTIARTAEVRIIDQLARGGALAGITVAPAAGDVDQLDVDEPAPSSSREIDEAAVRRIADVRGVDRVVPISGMRVFLAVPEIAPRAVHARDPILVRAVSFDRADASVLPMTVTAGRLPFADSVHEVAVTESHLARLGIGKDRAEGIIGASLAMATTRSGPTGTDLRWSGLRVVGVVAQEAAPAELMLSPAALRAARDWSGSSAVQMPEYVGICVVADHVSKVGGVRAAITKIGYSTSAPENLVASVQRYLRVLEIVLAGIGLIALGIAGLGIASAMLTAVRERRREIGVLKAIGARDADIRRVFLTEAALIGLAGACIGTSVGVLLAQAVGAVVNRYLTSQGLAGVHMTVPVAFLFCGVVLAALLSMLAGVVPAGRAARLPARTAVDG